MLANPLTIMSTADMLANSQVAFRVHYSWELSIQLHFNDAPRQKKILGYFASSSYSKY